MTRFVTVLATKEEIELTTTPVYPPIPTTAYDWSAIDSNTYDVSGYDGETGFGYSNHPNGHGPSEQEAINDLFDQIEE
jgi:hypothetical protein